MDRHYQWLVNISNTNFPNQGSSLPTFPSLAFPGAGGASPLPGDTLALLELWLWQWVHPQHFIDLPEGDET